MLTASHRVRSLPLMKLQALFAVFSLLGACAAPPDPDHRPPAAEIQAAPWAHPQPGVYFKVVDDHPTSLQRLFARVPSQPPDDIARAEERWKLDDEPAGTSVYLTAPTHDQLARFAASLTVPTDRELGYGRMDDGRWRTYLLVPAIELDTTAIAHAEATHDPNTASPAVMLDLTPAGRERFAELTSRIVGQRLAVLVDGTVVSAPIVRGAITGGHVEVTFATDGDAQSRALVDELDVR
jgi:hypothetical protein